MRQARRFVEQLLRGRRPRSFRADPEDAAEIRAAILLRAGAPGAGEPSEAFLTTLRRRLEVELSTQYAGRPEASRRRAIVQTASVAAASAAVGAAAGFLVRRDADAPAAVQTLTPNSGTWQPIVASTGLPDGAIQPFDLGTVAGFVQRVNGELRAVSAVCTHLGCRLRLNRSDRRLDCPCHLTSFSPDGDVLNHQLPASPPPLPHLQVRESDGVVEVLGPP